MSMPLRTWDKMPADKQAALRERAAQFLARMDAGEEV
jgi:deoxyribodipyrimidine photolyase-like uncharacterized protein